ncbi:sugar-binding transcriptional regulator [Aureimonas frigidaquae]|uniref:DeoR family transcriptional regulator n=1 Tax=Aureimonas frigidaquae TaxID=424757 RepID=A0A0P0Z2D3_9HYPH|nr:sugar-binding transcriptional regulator [Aureimonas frigidaquae]BAT28122.1 DeoR family transcriptional regulator [Aureimonas frigidaquae]
MTGPDALVEDGSADSGEINARVVWHYYVGGMTQQQVAEQFGLTRVRVNRIIGQARSEGLVRFDIRMPIANCISLAEEIRSRYGLDDAIVVPSLRQAEETQRVVGEAAGSLLDGMLRPGISLGVGWGRTLSAALRSLSSRRLADANVVTLMGSLTRGPGTNTIGVATAVANRIAAECHYLAAPIYCPSTEIRAALLSHPGLEEVMHRAANVDIAFISCGDLSARSILTSTSIVSGEIEELERIGAVGDILATFLGPDGTPVDHKLRDRAVGLSPDMFSRIPVRILASGGLHKLPVIKAVLNGPTITHLVTDEAVAKRLVGHDANRS